MDNRVVHFEIEALDVNRAQQFYSQAFGWNMSQMGGEYGEYVVAVTGDPKTPGGINGGIFKATDKKELNAYSCVISVDNIQDAVNNVTKAGGKILSETPDDIPGVGLYVKCEDTEGNRFTLLQPADEMTPQS